MTTELDTKVLESTVVTPVAKKERFDAFIIVRGAWAVKSHGTTIGDLTFYLPWLCARDMERMTLTQGHRGTTEI